MIFDKKKLSPDNPGGMSGDKTSGDNLSEAIKRSAASSSKKTKKPSDRGSENDFDKLSLRLMTIVAVVVFILALVNSFTADIIIERQLAEGMAARQSLIPRATEFSKIEELNLTKEESKIIGSVYEASDSETIYGYCVEVSTAGFGGEILMIVAVSPDLSVIGVKAISNSETPGIGAAVLSEKSTLLAQYKDLPSRSLNTVSAVTGATVTSNAVMSGVKTAVSVVANLMGGGE